MLVIKWTPAEGKRSQGRPRDTWRRTIEDDLKKNGEKMERSRKDSC